MSRVTLKAQQQETEVQKLYRKYLEYPALVKDASKGEILFQILSNLPVERNLRPITTPYTVFTLIALNIAIFMISISVGLERFLLDWAFIPGSGEVFPEVLFSLFLHGGYAHIMGNMYFLWLMGDNVEDIMGKRLFCLVYFSAGFIGFLVSAMSGPEGIPHIGASGAVSGIMAAYFLLFPKAQFLVRFFIVVSFPISSFLYIFFWIGINILNYLLGGNSGVAWGAHIAGFVVGLVITWIFKRRHGIPDQMKNLPFH
ncbi:MAG: rhomboid family intramembrane serine protease [Pseudobacteriovorax sp.]|nr:rhomboid family intramembrane serine protease [Pseudobacteriovorax sp.]